MDQPTTPRTDRRRRHAMTVLWTVALLLAAMLAIDEPGDMVGGAVRRLQHAAWAWPLAAALSATLLANQHVRRWWPDPLRRSLLAVVVFVGLYALAAAVGPLRAVLIVGLAATAGLLAAWVFVVPRRLAPPMPAATLDRLTDRDRIELTDARLKLQNDLRTTALQSIAVIAVLAGAVLAFQQLTEDRHQADMTQELARRAQTSERFTRAIDQLGSDRPEVQLGGIYALEQIAEQAPDSRLAVTDVLVAYLHRRWPLPRPATTQPTQAMRVRAPEAQAALTVLTRRTTDFLDPPLDLSGLDLRGADISGHLYHVDRHPHLRAGNLQRADFRGSDLRGATFTSVYLSNVDFRGANLRGTDLASANQSLTLADDFPTRPTDIEDAGLRTAMFTGAEADATTRWDDDFDWRAAGVIMT